MEMEKKRYSLRECKPRDFRTEEEILSDVRRQSKREYEEKMSSQETMSSQSSSGSHGDGNYGGSFNNLNNMNANNNSSKNNDNINSRSYGQRSLKFESVSKIGIIQDKKCTSSDIVNTNLKLKTTSDNMNASPSVLIASIPGGGQISPCVGIPSPVIKDVQSIASKPALVFNAFPPSNQHTKTGK